MNAALAIRGVISLSECAFMATAILFIAWFMTTMFRRNAAMRHLIWLLAFLSLLITPALIAFIPAHFIWHLPGAAATSSEGLRMGDGPSAGDARADNQKSNGAQRTNRSLPIAATVLGIWFTGIGVVALIGSAAASRIRRFRRRSVEHVFPALDAAGLSARIGLERRWKLKISSTPEPHAAMTWGVLHPIILLPKQAATWNSDRLEAVLLHELAHVRRYDSLSQWLTFAVCAIYWFHPSVWRFVRVMRAEAELAADDAVLVSGVKPSAYAAVLLRFAAELGQRRAPVYAGVSFMRQSRIATRIESILNLDQRERRVSSLQAGKAIGIGLVLVLLVAGLRPSVSLASSPSAPGKVFAVPIKAETPLSPKIQKMNQARVLPAIPAKASSTKQCHKKDAALKRLKNASAG
jgi:beta-lactamase regulating signal transducer with metallopeptidase domain